MKKAKLLYIILISFLTLTSCSNDDSNQNDDIIIGEWKAIEKYELNILVELPIISQCVYTTYTSDNRVYGDFISSNNLPSECTSLDFEFGWNWTNLGNNQYRIRRFEETGEIYTFYKDGVNLIQEYPDGITRFVYEPYE